MKRVIFSNNESSTFALGVNRPETLVIKTVNAGPPTIAENMNSTDKLGLYQIGLAIKPQCQVTTILGEHEISIREPCMRLVELGDRINDPVEQQRSAEYQGLLAQINESANRIREEVERAKQAYRDFPEQKAGEFFDHMFAAPTADLETQKKEWLNGVKRHG